MTTTIKDEMDRLLGMEYARPLEGMGQALIVIDRLNQESTDIKDLNGEWFDKLSDREKRSFLSGLAYEQLISVSGLLQRYIDAGLHG